VSVRGYTREKPPRAKRGKDWKGATRRGGQTCGAGREVTLSSILQGKMGRAFEEKGKGWRKGMKPIGAIEGRQVHNGQHSR